MQVRCADDPLSLYDANGDTSFMLVLLNWFLNSFLYYGIILLTPVFFAARAYTESDVYFYSLVASTSGTYSHLSH